MRKALTFLICLTLPSLYALGADFTADGLAYEILSEVDGSVQVVRGGNLVSGYVSIPGTVKHNGHTYHVTTIGDGAFLCCDRLVGIQMTDETTLIKERAFYGCSSLSDIVLGNHLERIGHYAFTYCRQLTSITLPATLSSIGRAAFRGCLTLSEINSLSMTPPTLTGRGPLASFAETPLKDIVVNVPTGCATQYLTAEGWSNFGHLTDQPASQGEILLSLTVNGIGAIVYDGQQVTTKGTWTLKRGTAVSLVLLPAKDQSVGTISVNGEDRTEAFTDDILQFAPLTANTLIEVSFIPRHAYLTLCHDSNGSLQMDMTEGQPVRLRILPHPGWTLHSVSIDGNDVTDMVDEDLYLTVPNAHSGMNIHVVLENNGKYAIWTADGVMSLQDTAPTINVPEEAVAVDLTSCPTSQVVPNSNPNTLYITLREGAAVDNLSQHNVVVDGHADLIQLTDGRDAFIPYDISADEARYTRTPAIGTNGQGGWESIVLPFAVESVVNGHNGLSLDWFRNDADIGKDFWVRRLKSVSTDNTLVFNNVAEWQANEPYIIAVPDATWGDFYDLRGIPLIFSAENTHLKATEFAMPSTDFQLVGTLAAITRGPIYTLNSSGDAFLLSENTTVDAFRAYLTKGADAAPTRLPISDTTHLTSVHTPATISSDTYLINGMVYRIPEGGYLPKGLYIINGRKQIVK